MAIDTKGKSLKQLAEERAVILTNAKSFHESNENAWDAEKEKTFSAMLEDASEYKAVITRRQALDDMGAIKIPDDPMGAPGRNKPSEKSKIAVRSGVGCKYQEADAGARGSDEYQTAFSRALLHGFKPTEMAALRSDKDPEGGYLVASEQFASELLKNVDDLLFIRRYANVTTVAEATALGIRKRTSQASTFGWSSELTVSTEDSSLAFGKKVLTPHHLTGMIKVSRDFLRRALQSPDSIVREELAIDAAQVMEDAYMTGNGASRPLGVFTASADGISTARDMSTDNTTTAITADGLLNAKYALKSQYRNMSPRWLFSRSAIKMISKLKDGGSSYLWQPGLTLDQPDRLLGYPVDESERCPSTFTTGLYVGLLACWRYYRIADALDMEMQVLTELYAGTNQVGYIGRLKTDGMPVLEEAFVRVTLA